MMRRKARKRRALFLMVPSEAVGYKKMVFSAAGSGAEPGVISRRSRRWYQMSRVRIRIHSQLSCMVQELYRHRVSSFFLTVFAGELQVFCGKSNAHYVRLRIVKEPRVFRVY
jgi:hypothetical protein